MEFFIELLLDLILEGSLEISTNRRISKWIRYPLILFIILFFLLVIIGIFILGILILKESKIFGYLIVLLDLFMFMASIIKFKKMYGKRTEEDEK